MYIFKQYYDLSESFLEGHYMLVEGASGNFFSRAILDSPVFQATAASCRVTFWYHMNGTYAGNFYFKYYTEISLNRTLNQFDSFFKPDSL